MLYTERTVNKFELQHRFEVLKDQLKWRAICDLPKSGSGSSKRSNLHTKETGDEGASGSERPEGWKAAKRRLKKKANNTVVSIVTTGLKETKSVNTDMNEIFKDFIITAKQEKTQKMMMKELKLRRAEDKIMMIDTSTMTSKQVAYYEQMKAEVMQRRLGHSSPTQ